ncbi:hypothetical protein GXP70_29270 [Paenibacillus lycopersici]|uniref:DUF6199 domain-containing protein n=1 Tax=Paenibacillus lycopersici TaxID=2704462 RepID=A0A6C0G5F9_9BACL|nr:hypothetical protein [Paenibacillus lycopersici]QHT63643.1 hypothetical protein GXP70_29270 [Paenibacillus lycopersici]
MPARTAIMKAIRTPSFVFFASVLLVSVLTGILSKPYFTERVFYLYENAYAFDGENDHLVTYHSSTGGPVQVRIDDELHRTVLVGGQSYSIADKSVPYTARFRVAYPNGHAYKVEGSGSGGLLLSYDDEGNLVSDVQMYANGERIKQEGEEDFPPSALVIAAYPDYHFKRGMPAFLYLALALLVYGWCAFRYEAFQTWTFRLSPQRLMYENPEPSDFYYFMCKAGGIVVMAGSLFVAFKAF